MTEPLAHPNEASFPTKDRVLDLVLDLGIPPPRQIAPARGGLTSQVWKLTPGLGPELFAKVSLPQRGTPLFPNLPAQEWEAMLHLSATGLAPWPMGKADLPDGGALIVTQAVPRDADLSPACLASLLARIHSTPRWSGLTRQDVSAQAVLDQASRILARTGVPKWLAALKPRNLSPDTTPHRLIHRDLVPANVAVTANGNPVALDWQCPALGDPCEDLAHATSPAMQSLSETQPMLEADAVVAAYPDPAIRARFAWIASAYRWRMACYCQWQVESGNAQYGAALALECAALEQVYERTGQHR